MNKVLTEDEPITHKLLVSRDTNADLFSDREETAIGYSPFMADRNRNQIQDGVELAQQWLQHIDSNRSQ